MDSNYMPLPERISKQFSEVDSDIVMDLWKNSPPYKALKQQMEEMKKQNPFIMQLLEGKGAVNLTGEEHEILTAFFRLYMKADNMEREHIYFRGHTDGFAYLQRIGALKNEYLSWRRGKSHAAFHISMPFCSVVKNRNHKKVFADYK